MLLLYQRYKKKKIHRHAHALLITLHQCINNQLFGSNNYYLLLIDSSRLSLAGSRTQLSSPSVENLVGSQHERKDNPESGIPVPTVVKRSSFVEV